jgi:hypothetical protein
MSHLLLSAAVVAVQVVLVTVNKVFYWELLRMLMKLAISHGHLDPNEWVACKSERLLGKIREAKRNRREGLDRFRQGQSRVMVLNLLVSVKLLLGELHPAVERQQKCGTALRPAQGRQGQSHVMVLNLLLRL